MDRCSANGAVGRVCAFFTLRRYGHWRRQHAGPHAVWNDLDHRDRGADIYSPCTTAAEHRAMGPWRRLGFPLEPERTLRFWSALSNELRALGGTTVHALEMPELIGPEVNFEKLRISPPLLAYVALRSGGPA